MARTLTDSSSGKTTRSFGIVQLLVLTGIFAVSFACAFPSTRLAGTPNPQGLFWRVLFGLPEVLNGVLSLTGLMFVATRCWKNHQRPTEPGSVLLLVLAAQFVLTNVFRLLYVALADPGGELYRSNPEMVAVGFTYVRCIPPLFLAVICIFGVRVDRWWWRGAFVALAISWLLSAVTILASLTMVYRNAPGAINTFMMLVYFQAGWHCFGFISVLLCCFVDLYRRIKRSRLHWFGVFSLIFCTVASPVVLLIALRFLSAQQLYQIP